MLRAFINGLIIHWLGLSRLVCYLLLIVLLGFFIAGLIYTSVVFHAITERNRAPHVQHHSTH